LLQSYHFITAIRLSCFESARFSSHLILSSFPCATVASNPQCSQFNDHVAQYGSVTLSSHSLGMLNSHPLYCRECDQDRASETNRLCVYSTLQPVVCTLKVIMYVRMPSLVCGRTVYCTSTSQTLGRWIHSFHLHPSLLPFDP